MSTLKATNLANASSASNNIVLAADGTVSLNELAQANTAGYLRLASGTGGIQFNGDTAAANSLDDYEEGTWTPTLEDQNGVVATAHSQNSGSYTKIGDRVYVTARVRTTSVVGLSGTSSTFIGGLPYVIANAQNARSSVTVGYAVGLANAAAYAVSGYGENGTTRATLTIFSSAAGVSALTINNWSDDGDAMISYSYRTS